MDEHREEHTIVKEVPLVTPVITDHHLHVGSRPVVETRYNSIVDEKQGMSGGAVAALVVAGITAAVLITVMILNSQQRTSDQEAEQERARVLAAQQQTPAQPGQPAQPVIVNMPTSQQPSVVPYPYPVPAPAQPAPVETKSGPSSAEVESDIGSRLRSDEVMRLHPVEVKVTGGTAMLSGRVPDEDLKNRAEKIARSANGVQRVINDISVRP